MRCESVRKNDASEREKTVERENRNVRFGERLRTGLNVRGEASPLAGLRLGLATAVMLILLTLASSVVRKIPDSQYAAERWDRGGGYTQISVFYGAETALRENDLEQIEAALEDVIGELEVDVLTAGKPGKTESEAKKAGSGSWISAYSAPGTVTIESGRTSTTMAAIGVGGDFFLFHPFCLRYGSFFSGDDLMQDRVVIDEETAWQLFGALDVAGMQVTIGGVSHVVAGVIARDCDWMEKRAGADEMTVYLSCDSLRRYGTTAGITCYEALLPEPVSGYGIGIVEEIVGNDEEKNMAVETVAGKNRENIIVVENNDRFSISNLLKVVFDFGKRSMQTSNIIMPVWENAARGWEDLLAVILVGQILCVAVLPVSAGMLCMEGRRRWRMRKCVKPDF